MRLLVRNDNRRKRGQLACYRAMDRCETVFLLSTSLRITAHAGEALEML